MTTTEIKKDGFPIHDYAALVPLASEAEQAALTADIKENGLRDPIVLWKGKIVDGRCRQKACLLVGERIRFKELDPELTDEEVRVFVKSVNTRRNLTSTQRIISACKVSLDPNNRLKIKELAKQWATSPSLLKNARYIATHAPEYIEPLFNGKAVTIVDSSGRETLSNKVSAVYASVKRQNEQVTENTEHGFQADTYIKTQAGKDWYYEQLKNGMYSHEHMLADLANFKFEKEEN